MEIHGFKSWRGGGCPLAPAPPARGAARRSETSVPATAASERSARNADAERTAPSCTPRLCQDSDMRRVRSRPARRGGTTFGTPVPTSVSIPRLTFTLVDASPR